LHQVDTGTSIEEVCRKVGISGATFYALKMKHDGLGVSVLSRLRQLEKESQKRKQLMADLSLDKVIFQDVLKKALSRHSGNNSLINIELAFNGHAMYA
jgi:putative transposase